MSDYVTKTNMLSALARFKENTDALYETKADANDMKSEIDQHDSRLQNLEQKAGDYSIVQYRGTNAVPTGKAKYGLVKSIVGKSRAWNQLVQNGNFAENNYWRIQKSTAGTLSISNNIARLSFSGLESDNTYNCGIRLVAERGYTIKEGHKYLYSFSAYTTYGSLITDQVLKSNPTTRSITPNVWNNYMEIATAPSDTDRVFLVYVSGSYPSSSDYLEFKNPQLFDLTLIFGSGNEPSTVADALAQLPALGQYNAYDAGSLVDTVVSGVRSRDTSDNVLDTLALSETVTLKNAGSVAEVLDVQTGKKTRPIGRIVFDENTNWTRSNDGVYFTQDLENLYNENEVPLCPPYCGVTKASNNGEAYNKGNMTCCFRGGVTDRFYIRDDYAYVTMNYTGAQFGEYVKNKVLQFALATPLSDEQVCDPIPDNTILTEGGGTIDTIQDQTPVIDNCLDVGYLAI